MSRVVVIGGGAAGMFASIFAARGGHEVTLFEKNEKLGKKLFITGKGRCNITNACDIDELFSSVRSNPKFLYSSFYGFTNEDTMEFFRSIGLPLKVERGNRVFPISDHSSDVIGCLSREMKKLGVKIFLNTPVEGLITKEEQIKGVYLNHKKEVMAEKVIVATGGISYQSTGSTGDGYRFAKEVGHEVTALYPSLVPLVTKEVFPKELQGLSLRNIEIKILKGKKVLYQDFGEMMFTHYGVTGPVIISASAHLAKEIQKENLSLFIDLKPALSKEQLDARILREFEENHKKQFKNALQSLFPVRLIPVMIQLSKIHPEKKVYDISKEERLHFVEVIKNFPLTITGLREYKEAVITKGGIKVKEVQPATMESKKISGLYFAGEVLDLDAVTGGYNLQIAWSTAFAAGSNIN